MSESNRRGEYRRIGLTIGAAVLIGLSLTGLFGLGQYQSDYVHHQQESARERTANPDTKCYVVFGITSLCIGGANDAKADAERAESDLQAQQNMAEWAKWLTGFTAAQIVIGAFGLWGLWRTWHEAKRTADAAVSSARAAHAANAYAVERETLERLAAIDARRISDFNTMRQYRAYLSVDLDGINAFKGMGATVVGHVNIRNAGLVPARDVRVVMDMAWDGNKTREIEHLIVVDENDAELADTIGVIQPSSFVAYGAPEKDITRRDGFIYVTGRVSYFDGFTMQRRHTEFCHRYPCARFETVEGERQINAKYGRYHTSGNNAD